MKTYFALSEYDNDEHIAVIVVPNRNVERLKFLIKHVLELYFNSKVLNLETENIEAIFSSNKPCILSIQLDDTSLYPFLELKHTYDIKIVKTKIYGQS